jgi:nucleotide-binding universal stress UspA family protein
MHNVIVACVDGSKGGYAAVAEAAQLSKRFGAELIALSVEEGLPRYAATMGEVDEFKGEKDQYFDEVAGQPRWLWPIRATRTKLSPWPASRWTGSGPPGHGTPDTDAAQTAARSAAAR